MEFRHNRTPEQMEGWLLKIDEIVSTDFCFDMECKASLPDQNEFTQQEARDMALLISNVYHYAHRIQCDACQHNETLLIEKGL